MELVSVLIFAAAVGVAVATPGPTIVMIVARVLAVGRRGHAAFAAGLIAGDVVWLAAAVFGMAALAETAHGVFVGLKYAGCAYLLWLAWKLWTAPAAALETDAASAATGRSALAEIFGGLAVALANPKTMLFYLALVPQMLDARTVDLAGFVELAAIVVVLYAGVLAGYVHAAARARRAFATPAAMRRVQRGSAVLLAGTAAAVAARG